MKYYLYHFEHKELDVQGAYQEGEPDTPQGRPPHWIDIPDDKLADKLKELATNYDLMFLGPTPSFPYYRIWLDRKNQRFRQR